jgi:hypothetical protein
VKLEVLAENFDYYSFGSLLMLQRQKPFGKFFTCSLPGDYSLMVESGVELTHFDEVETDWRCISIQGQLLFNEIGVAAQVTSSLASAAISVLVMSGYKTDYFFIKEDCLKRAVSCLVEAGHEFASFVSVSREEN